MTKMGLDTIEMTRQIRDAHYEEIKNKSQAERIAFYRARARVFRQQVAASLQDRKRAEHRVAENA